VESIEGRTAFVTGGASGIGLAIADALVAAGARVVLADWNELPLERERARLGDAALAQRFDVRDRAAWQHAKQLAEDRFGPVDILVNNAGLPPGGHQLVDMPGEHFDRLLAIMLTGVFNGVITFGAGMRERGSGHIVNTASMAGLLGSPGLGAYTAAKFAVVGLSEALRAELAPHGVGVTVLCPGLVRTNLGLNDIEEGVLPGAEDRSVLDGAMEPAVVAERVLDSIRHDDPYIITHADMGLALEMRADLLRRAVDLAADPASRGTQVDDAGSS
jgi:NAD(P)-dependent dehydrogenase (short-subunit alcohol dehydrogenase family)